MAKAKPKMHDLRVAALGGDYSASRALLRLSGHKSLAVEIRAGKPIPPRVRRMLGALAAGTNTEWEFILPDGTISNDLHRPPPPRGKARVARDILFDD
jgi:hypothetical protein